MRLHSLPKTISLAVKVWKGLKWIKDTKPCILEVLVTDIVYYSHPGINCTNFECMVLFVSNLVFKNVVITGICDQSTLTELTEHYNLQAKIHSSIIWSLGPVMRFKLVIMQR